MSQSALLTTLMYLFCNNESKTTVTVCREFALAFDDLYQLRNKADYPEENPMMTVSAAWHLGNKGESCDVTCTSRDLQCTEKSVSKQTALSPLNIAGAVAAFQEAGAECSTIKSGSNAPFVQYWGERDCFGYATSKWIRGQFRESCDKSCEDVGLTCKSAPTTNFDQLKARLSQAGVQDPKFDLKFVTGSGLNPVHVQHSDHWSLGSVDPECDASLPGRTGLCHCTNDFLADATTTTNVGQTSLKLSTCHGKNQYHQNLCYCEIGHDNDNVFDVVKFPLRYNLAKNTKG